MDPSLLTQRFREAVSLMEFGDQIARAVRTPTGLPKRPPLQPMLLMSTLLRHEVEFLVHGVLAMSLHEATRASDHVDIMVRDAPENHEPLSRALDDLVGNHVECPHFEHAVIHSRGVLGAQSCFRTQAGYAHVGPSGPSATYADLRCNAIAVATPEGRIWFAGKDDLIAMKRAAGRPQDLLDIERIERGGDPLTGY